MRELFLGLREAICGRAINPNNEMVRRPYGQAQAPQDAWESYICKYATDNSPAGVSVILQYKSPNRYRNTQRIRVGEYYFAVRLVVFDHGNVPDGLQTVDTKQALCNKLMQYLPNCGEDNEVYEVDDHLNGNITGNGIIGGIIQLGIKQRAAAWHADNEQDRDDFVFCVMTALKDLLPIAQKYAYHRKSFLER